MGWRAAKVALRVVAIVILALIAGEAARAVQLWATPGNLERAGFAKGLIGMAVWMEMADWAFRPWRRT